MEKKVAWTHQPIFQGTKEQYFHTVIMIVGSFSLT